MVHQTIMYTAASSYSLENTVARYGISVGRGEAFKRATDSLKTSAKNETQRKLNSASKGSVFDSLWVTKINIITKISQDRQKLSFRIGVR